MFSKDKRSAGLRKTQFVALQSLPYYNEIVEKIKAGVPCSQIAAWIQVVKKSHTDKNRKAIQKQLERLRKNIAPKSLVDKALIESKEKEVGEMISIVKEAQYLMRLNKTRIKRNEKTERNSPISLKSQDSAIQLQLDLITVNKEMMQDLGILTQSREEERPGITVTETSIVNMNVDELEERHEKLLESISNRLKRIRSARNRAKRASGTGEESVSSPQPTV